MYHLTSDQILQDRPFTHPSYGRLDKRQMRYMLMRLAQIVRRLERNDNPNLLNVETHELFESDGRHHRVIPIRPKLLCDASSLTVVGFFGQRNLFADGTAIADRDKMLYDEMRSQPGLLSYSTMELTNGDYGNTVVFADEAAKNHWGQSSVHASAVRELSPEFYDSIRLYNGAVEGCVMDIYKLKLTAVKYYQYMRDDIWMGSRPIDL